MDKIDDYRDIYESNRLELVRNLRIHRTFLFDYLRNKKVLDQNDCELIQAETTSEQKAGKLLDLLSYKGKEGFVCFTEALQLQSPELYEVLTGKDACSTPNPILKRYHNSRLGIEGGMEDNEMELLTEHLSRSYAELQRISEQYNTVVKEKRKLEGKLMMNEVDLERQKSQVTAWEERFYKEKTCSLKKQTQTQRLMDTITFESEKRRETIQRLKENIIRLEMELLVAHEEVDELKTGLNNANKKKEEEMRYRQEMGESYEKERKQAARLSLRLKCQEDELQALDILKQQCKELEHNRLSDSPRSKSLLLTCFGDFLVPLMHAMADLNKAKEKRHLIQAKVSNVELREENEKLHKDLHELEKWTKGLKDRFDLIKNDNIRARESNHNVAMNIKVLQEETKELRQQNSYLEIENDFLKLRATFLEKDCDIYKKQRDTAMHSRNEAAEERDKARREREMTSHHYIEMLKSRDSEIEKREACMKELDEVKDRFNETASELAKTKLKLNETKLVVDEMKLKMDNMRKTEEDHERNTCTNSEESKCNEKETTKKDQKFNRVYSRKSLIQSIKRRVRTPSNVDENGDSATLFRTSSIELLISLLADFSEEDDTKDRLLNKKLNRASSCPRLDEISNPKKTYTNCYLTLPSTRSSFVAKSMPDLFLSHKQDGRGAKEHRDTVGTESDNYASTDSEEPDDFVNYPLSPSNKKHLSEDKPFRRRTDVMSTDEDLPLRPFRRRSNAMLVNPKKKLLSLTKEEKN